MRVFAAVFVVALAGCSLVYDVDRHTENAGMVPDAAVEDAGGPDTDAGVPDAGQSPIDSCNDIPEFVEALDFCTLFTTLLCEAQQHCCTQDPLSVLECRTMLMADCGDTLGRAAADPQTAYSESLAGQAFAMGCGLAEMCDPTILDFLSDFDRGALSIFRGSNTTDDRCSDVLVPPLEDQLSCMGEALCLPVGGWFESVCRPFPGSGERCQPTLPCTRGYFCDSRAGGEMAECMPLLDDGMPCTAPEQCASFVCDMGRCRERTENDAYCFSELQILPGGDG